MIVVIGSVFGAGRSCSVAEYLDPTRTNEGFDLAMGTHRPPHDRPDLHNPSVDEQVALAGGCGQVHLASGRTCTLDQDHAGSCHFTPHDTS
jgi:hypothetical protein